MGAVLQFHASLRCRPSFVKLAARLVDVRSDCSDTQTLYLNWSTTGNFLRCTKFSAHEKNSCTPQTNWRGTEERGMSVWRDQHGIP
jgi:hypothetical protein